MKTFANRTIAVAGAAAAMAAVTVLATLPADASSVAKKTWTLKAGSAKTGSTVKFTGSAKGTTSKPAIHFTDKNTGVGLTCQSGSTSATAKVGKGKSGTGIAKVTGSSLKFTSCKAPGDLPLTVKGHGTWNLNASSFSKSGGGTVTGSLTKVDSTVTSTFGCTFTATGSVPSTYSNKTHKLTMPGKKADLLISKASGCSGLVKKGDHSTFKAVFTVKSPTSADNPITITSP